MSKDIQQVRVMCPECRTYFIRPKVSVGTPEACGICGADEHGKQKNVVMIPRDDVPTTTKIIKKGRGKR